MNKIESNEFCASTKQYTSSFTGKSHTFTTLQLNAAHPHTSHTAHLHTSLSTHLHTSHTAHLHTPHSVYLHTQPKPHIGCKKHNTYQWYHTEREMYSPFWRDSWHVWGHPLGHWNCWGNSWGLHLYAWTQNKKKWKKGLKTEVTMCKQTHTERVRSVSGWICTTFYKHQAIIELSLEISTLLIIENT